MKQTRRLSRWAACAFAIGLAGAAPQLLAAQAQTTPPASNGGYGYGYGMGPGMMGGYGPGYSMMGGYGPGYSMMGGYGPGYGMGPGMMGGYGMMGPYWGSGLDLTEQQQAKIDRIVDQTRKAHWALMGAMMDQQARLRDLYSSPTQDQAAIDEAYKNLSVLQKQMFDTAVAARKEMEAVLTKDQQEQLRKNWRQGWVPQP